MKYIDLIGIKLKDEVLSELFETKDVEVIYEYDRTHEGMPDEYRAIVPDLGLEFVFDEHQKFYTLFKTLVVINTFNPFDEDSLIKFKSKSDIRQYADNNKINFSEGKADFMGEERDWIRLEYGTYSIHYQFVDSKLRMITIQSEDA